MHATLEAGTIAIYARFSSERQRETSIEDQVRRCRDYIAQAGGDPERAVVFTDFAVSGASLARPGFEALMQGIEQRRVSTIVTEDLSRISRDFADAAVIFKKLQFVRVPLIGVADGIDTSAKDAKLSFTLKSLVSDLFLDDLRDKTLRGLEGRALAGYATGNTPYGYRTVPELDAAGRKLGHRIEIDEEQAAIVRWIFMEYLKGGSLSGIAVLLNQRGIASPRAGTRHKRQGWGSSTIRAMLYNEKYAGVWRFKEREWVKLPGTNRRVPRDRDASEVMCVERPELRIIDADLWDQVQIRLKSIKRKYTKKSRERVIAGNKSNYLLSGILVCGECGAPMTIHGGQGIKYYRCADNRTKGTCDNARSIREDVIRRRILQGIRERLMSDQGIAYVRKRVAVELRDFSRRIEEELNERRARLTRTEEQIQRLIRFIAQGERSDYLGTALRDLEAEARADKIEIARLTQQAQAPLRLPSIKEVTALVFDLDSRLTEDPEAGRQLLRRWFQDHQIQIVPQDDGSCLAQGALLPLVILDAANNTAAKAAKKGPKKAKGSAREREALWSNLCSGDPQSASNNAILLDFAPPALLAATS